MLHFAGRRAMDIEGLGDKLVDQLVDSGLIRTLPELYTLGVAKLSVLERMGEKSAANLVAGLDKSRQTTLARFLYAMPASNVGRRDVRKHTPIPEEVADEYKLYLHGLLRGVPGELEAPKVLTLSDAAREAWLDLAEEVERQQGEGGRYESISDWTSKLPGAVARIAALLELAQTGLEAVEVSFDAMNKALTLGRLLIPHAQAAFGLLGTDAVDNDASAILKWARANELGEFTRRECQKAQEGRFRSMDRLQKALARLEHQDVVREFKRHNKGAPPTTAYKVNPKVLAT